MADGIGCSCAAYSGVECCCDADWTPQEVYDLREKLSSAEQRVNELENELREVEAHYNNACTKIEVLQAKCAELERMLDISEMLLGNTRKALKAQAGEPRRKVYVCRDCGGVYADEKVSQCDCLGSEIYDEGVIVMTTPSTPAAEQAIQDTLRYGVHATKDGKRIDPADLYPAAEPAKTMFEQAVDEIMATGGCFPDVKPMAYYEPDSCGLVLATSWGGDGVVFPYKGDWQPLYTHPTAERPDHRKVMKMALEALEYHTKQTRPIHQTLEAIVALRNALKGEV